MKIELPFNDWNDIVKTAGSVTDSYIAEVEVPIAKPVTEKQTKKAYMRKARLKSIAKKKATTPGIKMLRG